MQDSRSLPKKLLVAVDGSEESFAAARYAIDLAENLKAKLSALHVMLLPEYVSEEVRNRLKIELESRGESTLLKIRQAAQGRSVVLQEKMMTTTKSVVATICDQSAKDDADLIVMGTSGAGGVAKIMLGSVAVGVSREASCPVLLVR